MSFDGLFCIAHRKIVEDIRGVLHKNRLDIYSRKLQQIFYQNRPTLAKSLTLSLLLRINICKYITSLNQKKPPDH